MAGSSLLCYRSCSPSADSSCWSRSCSATLSGRPWTYFENWILWNLWLRDLSSSSRPAFDSSGARRSWACSRVAASSFPPARFGFDWVLSYSAWSHFWGCMSRLPFCLIGCWTFWWAIMRRFAAPLAFSMTSRDRQSLRWFASRDSGFSRWNSAWLALQTARHQAAQTREWTWSCANSGGSTCLWARQYLSAVHWTAATSRRPSCCRTAPGTHCWFGLRKKCSSRWHAPRTSHWCCRNRDCHWSCAICASRPDHRHKSSSCHFSFSSGCSGSLCSCNSGSSGITCHPWWFAWSRWTTSAGSMKPGTSWPGSAANSDHGQIARRSSDSTTSTSLSCCFCFCSYYRWIFSPSLSRPWPSQY